jgi:polyphosphate kinase
VTDPALSARLREVLDIYLKDTARTRRMKADGSYERVRPRKGAHRRDAQARLAEKAHAAHGAGV